MSKVVFSLLIITMFALGCYSLVRNYASFVKHEIPEIFESDDIKRIKYFGSTYPVVLSLKSNIPDQSSLYLVADDQKTHFLSKYFLYPRKVFFSETVESNFKHGHFDYYVVIDNLDSTRKYVIPLWLKFQKHKEIYISNYKIQIFML